MAVTLQLGSQPCAFVRRCFARQFDVMGPCATDRRGRAVGPDRIDQVFLGRDQTQAAALQPAVHRLDFLAAVQPWVKADTPPAGKASRSQCDGGFPARALG